MIGERCEMIIRRSLSALFLLLMTCNALSAKGGSYRMEDRYNPQHVDNLPAEVRTSIFRTCKEPSTCKEPKALHPFAAYSDGSRKIELHFEHFLCNGGDSYCRPSGCLHQVWVWERGHYRLTQSFYAPAGDRIGAW